ncbi:MAG: hypothetical protein MI757_03635 [Pirellulales bacterium]|nr:hypothetical protein [Pirellulales bacterium]
MFDWFSSESTDSGSPGLLKMRAEFGQMMDAGRHMFNTAANAFLGGTELDVIRQDVFKTDKRINYAQQQIRREIVVHATVHGAAEFPACLILMSVTKDAERVGDYSKNIFDLAELSPQKPAGEYKEDLTDLKDRISALMADCREAFDKEDAESARRLIVESQQIEDQCDTQISTLVQAGAAIEMGTTYALAYRYFKRVSSHAFNVATTIVQPLDKIDFSEGDDTEAASADTQE